ncbi:hypothetical protein WJX72_002685 [[Myrmecia] bisecta]|uniref:Uncharacterized protein n=1 Tax=[Myrmecia] bisecta TaxID=41462 RepID=A0AAW1Q425_9CHLO
MRASQQERWQVNIRETAKRRRRYEALQEQLLKDEQDKREKELEQRRQARLFADENMRKKRQSEGGEDPNKPRSAEEHAARRAAMREHIACRRALLGRAKVQVEARQAGAIPFSWHHAKQDAEQGLQSLLEQQAGQKTQQRQRTPIPSAYVMQRDGPAGAVEHQAVDREGHSTQPAELPQSEVKAAPFVEGVYESQLRRGVTKAASSAACEAPEADPSHNTASSLGDSAYSFDFGANVGFNIVSGAPSGKAARKPVAKSPRSGKPLVKDAEAPLVRKGSYARAAQQARERLVREQQKRLQLAAENDAIRQAAAAKAAAAKMQAQREQATKVAQASSIMGSYTRNGLTTSQQEAQLQASLDKLDRTLSQLAAARQGLRAGQGIAQVLTVPEGGEGPVVVNRVDVAAKGGEGVIKTFNAASLLA